MKYCSNCGEAILENGKYCPCCGNPTNEQVTDEKLQKTERGAELKTKNSKENIKTLKGIIIGTIILALCVIVYIFSKGSTEGKAYSAAEKQSYENSVEENAIIGAWKAVKFLDLDSGEEWSVEGYTETWLQANEDKTLTAEIDGKRINAHWVYQLTDDSGNYFYSASGMSAMIVNDTSKLSLYVGDLIIISEGDDGEVALIFEKQNYSKELREEKSNDTATSKPTTNSENGSVFESSGQKNALESAKGYLAVMAFSKEGLIKQLEYEGYTNSEATYAVENCGADWNEQAVKKAKEYLDVMPFSRDELVKQLEYEGFTSSQANYGVKKAY